MCERRKRMQLVSHSAAIRFRPHPTTGGYRAPPSGGHHREARRVTFCGFRPAPRACRAGWGQGTWPGARRRAPEWGRAYRAVAATTARGGHGLAARDPAPAPEVRRLLLLGSHPAAGAPLGRPYALALRRGTARPRQSSKHPSGTDRPRHFSLVRCKLPAWPADQRGDALDVGGGCEGAGVTTEPKPSVLQAGSGSLQAFEPGVRTAS
jgi:hypothetical protein